MGAVCLRKLCVCRGSVFVGAGVCRSSVSVVAVCLWEQCVCWSSVSGRAVYLWE